MKCLRCKEQFLNRRFSRSYRICNKCRFKKCEYCGKKFEPNSGNLAQKFCCKVCFERQQNFTKTNIKRKSPSASPFGIVERQTPLTEYNAFVHRRDGCEHYDDCLSFAALSRWRSFSCLQCTDFALGQRLVCMTYESTTVLPAPPVAITNKEMINMSRLLQVMREEQEPR